MQPDRHTGRQIDTGTRMCTRVYKNIDKAYAFTFKSYIIDEPQT